MFSLTPQERRIVTFLLATLLIGCVVRLVRYHFSAQPPDVSVVSTNQSSKGAFDAPAPDSQAVKPPERIDINTAGLKQLQSLSGIGPQLARRIVEYRDQHGPFSSPEDITAVPGIGAKTYQRLCDRIMIASNEIRGKDEKK